MANGVADANLGGGYGSLARDEGGHRDRGEILGIGRTQAHAVARAGLFPAKVIWVGRAVQGL